MKKTIESTDRAAIHDLDGCYQHVRRHLLVNPQRPWSVTIDLNENGGSIVAKLEEPQAEQITE